MIMCHCKYKGMYIRTSYKNFKTSLPILRYVMFLMQKIQAKITLLWLLRKILPRRKMSFMSIPTILREYKDGLSPQKWWFKAQYPHHSFIIEELNNASSIHAFNRFEEKGYIERFQCDLRLFDIPCDVFYALTTPAIQEIPR